MQHVGVGASPDRQVVLAREPHSLVVVGLEEQASVVHLKQVYVGEVSLERRGVGDRVQAVEGMWDVHEPALVVDRRDRLGEREAGRNLFT